jgi:serine/threonine protein phosphatase 1
LLRFAPPKYEDHSARHAPATWRARVEADLAGVADAFRPLARASQMHRFRASADALKPISRVERGRGAPAWAQAGVASAGTAGQVVHAIGDVHGRYDLLRELLVGVARDRAREPGRAHLLVLLGDYIDRGPDSPLVVETLVWLSQRDPEGVCLLKGNHEQGLLDFLDGPEKGVPWLRFGGRETLAAYGVQAPDTEDAAALAGARDALLAAMPASHLRRLQTLEAMAVVGGYVFAHAGVAPGRPLAAQREAELLWIRQEFLSAARPCPKVVVHGHTWRSGAPELLEGRIGIDTGAYETGLLTAVRLDGAQRRVMQARDPDSCWAPTVVEPQLVTRPQDFRQLGWSPELSFSKTRAAPSPAEAIAPDERPLVLYGETSLR